MVLSWARSSEPAAPRSMHRPRSGVHVPRRRSPRRTGLERAALLSDHRTRGRDSGSLRPAIGNRIFGCDDCRWSAWKHFTGVPTNPTSARGRDMATLRPLFAWSEDEFLRRTEGSAIRRSGHERWLRNVAVALGNRPSNARMWSPRWRAAGGILGSCASICTWALAGTHLCRRRSFLATTDRTNAAPSMGSTSTPCRPPGRSACRDR